MKTHAFVFIFLLSLFFSSIVYGQDEKEKSFEPAGYIIARSFFDFSQGFGHVNKESGFDLTRAFLGYNYQFTPTLQARVIVDGASGRNDKGNLEVYVRSAYVNWADKGFDINIGEIGLLQFSLQEDYWKHRYVLRIFQDLNKMAPSADLGITTKYKINDYISADISITNGEGYKNVVKNNSTRYAAGASLNPFQGAVFRVYADIYNDGEDARDQVPEGSSNIGYKDQKTLSLFAGYKTESLSAGVEYSRIYNKGFIQDKDYYGYSFYTSIEIAPQWNVYARYDWLDSKKPSGFASPWNDSDGQLMIAGIEFRPIKQLKISPNLRNINPDRKKAEQYLFVNFEFNL